MQMFFNPESVVLIGVTRQSGKGAYNNLEMMLRYGFKGRVYVVHPKVSEILGHKTYSAVGDLPEVPALAIISLGRDRVLPAFTECAEKGIRRVIVISQGFADADARGSELQDQLVQVARQYDVRVVGPNTMGVVDAFSGLSTAFIDLERNPSPPGLALIVQSGVFQVGHESFTGPYGKSLDVGNACDVDALDVLEYLEQDPQTRVIFLHMEGMKRGRDFLRIAARVAEKKPVVILKTGRSTAGAKAALSHTGSLVGEDPVFDAAFHKAGLTRVHNMVELRAVCEAFLKFQSIKGPKIGVVTATGACGIITADACEDHGMELAPFPEAIREGLENPHIAWHKLHNPVDLWPLGMVSGSFIGVFKKAVEGLLNSQEVDAVLCIAPTLCSELHDDVDMVASIREVNRMNIDHKPIAVWFYGGDEGAQSPRLKDEPNVACFDSIDEAVMGLSALWRYKKIHGTPRERASLFAPLSGGSGQVGSRPMEIPSSGFLIGESAFHLLNAYGIPTVPSLLVQQADSAASFAARTGYPVVLKIISPQWLHKSDWAGIRLGIATEDELHRAYNELTALFRDRTPSGVLQGILVQKQITGAVELLMGIKRDPQFGPILLAGMGGVFAEVFRDVSRDVAPVEECDADRMLRALRIFPLLKGARGQKGVDLDALKTILVSLSRLALDYPEISELDLNPVMATPEGCWCVDSRVVL